MHWPSIINHLSSYVLYFLAKYLTSYVHIFAHFLFQLESNLHSRALSADWHKQVDSVTTLGSASHIMSSSLRMSSKNGIGRRRPRFSDLEPKPSLKAASGLVQLWWRGGRISRGLFKWKVLPRSLVSKAARQGLHFSIYFPCALKIFINGTIKLFSFFVIIFFLHLQVGTRRYLVYIIPTLQTMQRGVEVLLGEHLLRHHQMYKSLLSRYINLFRK